MRASPVQVKERPILMHARSIRGILEGRKVQTRRIIRPQPPRVEDVQALSGTAYSYYRNEFGDFSVAGPVWAVRQLGAPQHLSCPYGRPGDRLWVREAWKARASFDALKPVDVGLRVGKDVLYLADNEFRNLSGVHEPFVAGRYRHARFMPYWACRLSLELTNIRVERVQDISHADAIQEGCFALRESDLGREDVDTPRDQFRQLWDDTNGKHSWESNPWVWVIEFRKL